MVLFQNMKKINARLSVIEKALEYKPPERSEKKYAWATTTGTQIKYQMYTFLK